MPKGATFLVDRDEFGQQRIKYAPKPYKTFYKQGDLNEYAMAINQDTPEMLIESNQRTSILRTFLTCDQIKLCEICFKNKTQQI